MRIPSDRRDVGPLLNGGEDLFRLFVECVVDYALLMLDPQGHIATWNIGAERIKGWRYEEIVGRHFSTFYPPEDVAAGKPERELHDAARDGRFEDEGWRVRKDGSRFWANVVITALRDRGGTLLGFAKITRDLTVRREAEETARKLAAEQAARIEHERAEASLRESEAQFHALADSIPHLAWMAGADGYIHWYNRRWYEYTGTTPDEIKGWGWQAVHDPEDLPRVLSLWKAALASGEPWQDEFRLRRRDGVLRWHLSRAMPVRDNSGRVVRWFGTNTEIEDQKRTVAELQRAEEETRRIGHVQEQLLAVVGHDLRTPLSAISMALALMQKRGGLSVDQQRTLERIRSSAAKMNAIVSDLLDFSRARQGLGMPIKRADANVGEVCRRAIIELSQVHPDRAVQLQVEGDPALEVDASRLAQVVSNLLGNALQHGSVAPVRVAVNGREDEIELSVHNEGTAIPAAELPHLFEPFRRGRGARARDEGSGSIGLGLFIVNEIVKAHGGTVEARSAPEEGTTFTVRLPRHPSQRARGEVFGIAEAPQR